MEEIAEILKARRMNQQAKLREIGKVLDRREAAGILHGAVFGLPARFLDGFTLPDDILGKILTFLPSSDVNGVLLVAKHWHRVMAANLHSMPKYKLDYIASIGGKYSKSDKKEMISIAFSYTSGRGWDYDVNHHDYCNWTMEGLSRFLKRVRCVDLDVGRFQLKGALPGNTACRILEELIHPKVRFAVPHMTIECDLRGVPAESLGRFVERMTKRGMRRLDFRANRMNAETIDARIMLPALQSFILYPPKGRNCPLVTNDALVNLLSPKTTAIELHNCPTLTAKGIRDFAEKWLVSAKEATYTDLILGNCARANFESVLRACGDLVQETISESKPVLMVRDVKDSADPILRIKFHGCSGGERSCRRRGYHTCP